MSSPARLSHRRFSQDNEIKKRHVQASRENTMEHLPAERGRSRQSEYISQKRREFLQTSSEIDMLLED